jgi:hypothetical protein
MPYKSKAQRAYLHIHHKDVAERWDREYGGGGKNLPEHVRKKVALDAPKRPRKRR